MCLIFWIQKEELKAKTVESQEEKKLTAFLLQNYAMFIGTDFVSNLGE